MDRFTRTADIIKAYYSYKQTADSATFVKKVCSFFDFIKDESLSDADLNLLLFLANEAGIPQYYDLLKSKFTNAEIGDESINSLTMSALFHDASLIRGDSKLHRYQKHVLDSFVATQRNRYVLTAPTSFGKTFLVYEIIQKMQYQELICKGWFLPPNTYDCGSFVVNGTAVVGKESKHLITAGNQHTKELIFMKSLFDQMGGTYHQEGDYLIPNLTLPDEPEYQIGKYGRMRRSYLKAHRPVLYANFLTSGTLHRHLAEIDQACNEHMEIIVSAMAKQESATEALKAADQLEWVRRMNSIRSRAEEIVLTELVYN